MRLCLCGVVWLAVRLCLCAGSCGGLCGCACVRVRVVGGAIVPVSGFVWWVERLCLCAGSCGAWAVLLCLWGVSVPVWGPIPYGGRDSNGIMLTINDSYTYFLFKK